MVDLSCDNCRAFKHDACQRTVRAFIDPDGPDDYVCGCYCNRQRLERDTADRKVAEVLNAYKRRYGAVAVAAVVDPWLPEKGEPADG
jgi:hypothetical protein